MNKDDRHFNYDFQVFVYITLVIYKVFVSFRKYHGTNTPRTSPFTTPERQKSSSETPKWRYAAPLVYSMRQNTHLVLRSHFHLARFTIVGLNCDYLCWLIHLGCLLLFFLCLLWGGFLTLAYFWKLAWNGCLWYVYKIAAV